MPNHPARFSVGRSGPLGDVRLEVSAQEPLTTGTDRLLLLQDKTPHEIVVFHSSLEESVRNSQTGTARPKLLLSSVSSQERRHHGLG